MPTPRITSFNIGVQHEAAQGHDPARQLRRDARRSPDAHRQHQSAARRHAPRRRRPARRMSTRCGRISATAPSRSPRTPTSRTITACSVADAPAAGGLEFGANYTFSKALDTSSGTPEDSYNIARDYGLSTVHRAHNFNSYFIWQVPSSATPRNACVRGALGGWDISGVAVYQSGAPFTVTAPVDTAPHRRQLLARVADRRSRPAVRRSHPAALVQHRRLPRPRAHDRQASSATARRNLLIGRASAASISASPRFRRAGAGSNSSLAPKPSTSSTWISFTGLNTTVRFDAAGNPTGGYGQVTSAAPGRVLEFGVGRHDVLGKQAKAREHRRLEPEKH